MNILFLNDYNVTSYTGGVAMLTSTLSQGFKNSYNYNCYLAFFGNADKETAPVFDSVLKIVDKSHFADLQDFISDNAIDVIISTLVGSKANYSFFSDFYKYIKTNTACKLYWIYLNRPDYDVFLLYQLQSIQRRFPCGKIVKSFLDTLLHFSVAQPFVQAKMHLKFSIPHDNCDKTVVLSPNYVNMFYDVAKIDKDDSVLPIGNPLNFRYEMTSNEIKQKGKHVLMVVRFDEAAKRLCLALKIWQTIEEIEGNDWDLTIIGFGVDEQLVKNYAKELKLNRVYFVGQQNPIDFYKKSSIYMMTSAYEGFPLVLNDAKQFGIVPIVFNTFEAASDLISNGNTGILVDEGDIESYKCQLITLMNDIPKREQMAMNAVVDAKNYSVENICNQWNNLFGTRPIQS